MKAVSLHLQRKNVVLYVIAYILIVLSLTAVVAIPMASNLEQIYAFAESNYLYSAVAPNSVAPDAYYKYDAGISFSASSDGMAGINAEVVMQTENAQYTDMVYWNTDRLDEGALAISENIASANKLQVGDHLYSKNVVDGQIHEFTIEDILPAVTYTRGYRESFHNDGVIIMGYNHMYADNVTHTCIVFTQMPINELTKYCTAMPEDIVYMNDEISSLAKLVAPYLVAYILGVVATITVLTMYLSKEVSHNFSRLIMLGFEKNALNKAYLGYIGKLGVLSIATTVIVATIAFADVGWIAVMLVSCVAIIEALVLIIATTILNKRLWRK